jgi:hypothetical protein
MAVIFGFNGKTVAEFKHALEGMLGDISVKALSRKLWSTANGKT